MVLIHVGYSLVHVDYMFVTCRLWFWYMSTVMFGTCRLWCLVHVDYIIAHVDKSVWHMSTMVVVHVDYDFGTCRLLFGYMSTMMFGTCRQ